MEVMDDIKLNLSQKHDGENRSNQTSRPQNSKKGQGEK